MDLIFHLVKRFTVCYFLFVGVLRSPAIYIINHYNDIFVQVKKGERVGKLVSLMVMHESKQPVIRGEGAKE